MNASRFYTFLFVACSGIFTGGLLGQTPVVDGRFLDVADYDLIYDVSYSTAFGDVDGGILAFATAPSGTHFLYFQMPTDYVDNTWGATQIGTYRNGGHTFRRLWDGDSFGINHNFEIMPTGGQADLRFRIDVIASTLTAAQAGPGTGQEFYTGQYGQFSGLANDNGSLAGTSDPSLILDVDTSLSWNILHFGPGGTGAISQADLDEALNPNYANRPGVFKDSPSTDANYTPPTVDDPLTSYDDTLFADWVFPLAFEMELDADLFGSEWTDPATALSLVDVGTGHFSNNKLGVSTLTNPSFELVSVPEPSTGLFLAVGGILFLFRRERRRVRVPG